MHHIVLFIKGIDSYLLFFNIKLKNHANDKGYIKKNQEINAPFQRNRKLY